MLTRELVTERLVIRPARAEDAAATWAYRQLESVWEWITWPARSEEEYTERFLDPERLSSTAVIELAAAGRAAPVIGDLMIKIDDAWAQYEVREQAAGQLVELGWCLDPAHTGAGYATEAVREMIRWCFEELGVHRVVANCFADNTASWRLMERVGMRRETHAVAESLHRSGRWLDSYAYALLEREWPDGG